MLSEGYALRVFESSRERGHQQERSESELDKNISSRSVRSTNINGLGDQRE